MRASKVIIENPAPGGSAITSLNRARRFVDTKRAVFTGPQAIRFVVDSPRIELLRVIAQAAEDRVHRALTGGGYDGVRSTFYAEAPAIPIVNAAKMIRQERSERNWSYTSSVRRAVRRDHTAEEVAVMRVAR